MSNIFFSFDGSKPAGSRVDASSVTISGNTLELEHSYSTATKWFLSKGRDGYDMFVDKPFILDYENGLPHL